MVKKKTEEASKGPIHYTVKVVPASSNSVVRRLTKVISAGFYVLNIPEQLIKSWTFYMNVIILNIRFNTFLVNGHNLSRKHDRKQVVDYLVSAERYMQILLEFYHI